MYQYSTATSYTVVGSNYQGWKLKPKPKPENPVLKEILETQTETDTYLAKFLKTWTGTETVFSWNVKTETETKTCSKFFKVLGFKNCHHHPYQRSSYNAERRIEKLWILIFESLVSSDSESYPSRQLLKQLLSSLGHLTCYLSS